MPSVSVSLNEITRTGAGARADDRTLLAADERATYGADRAANNRAFRLAVMVPVSSSVSGDVHNGQNEQRDY
jgi:hypothetical protein